MFENLKESNPLLLVAGIVLIPIGVAAVSLWVDTRIDERQRLAAKELYQRQEMLTVTQTIDAYFQGIGSLAATDMESESGRRIIVARTNALLGRLTHPKDKALVVRFISDLRPELVKRPERALERASQPFVDLAGMDLRGTDLSYVNLNRANLPAADLSGANLQWANLSDSNLQAARLDEADLRGVALSRSVLGNASLRGAKLGGASFTGASLNNTDLGGADLSGFEFEGAVTETSLTRADLSGAVWTDGSRCAAGSVGRCDRNN